jgi:hypothetical protein
MFLPFVSTLLSRFFHASFTLLSRFFHASFTLLSRFFHASFTLLSRCLGTRERVAHVKSLAKEHMTGGCATALTFTCTRILCTTIAINLHNQPHYHQQHERHQHSTPNETFLLRFPLSF